MTRTGGIPGSAAGPDQIGPSVDSRARARWLLHEAREKLIQGKYDEAQHKADEADALNVKWGLFDDTPARVGEDIKKARPKAVASRAGSAIEVHDRRAAKAKLREARAAIGDRRFEQAEAIALDVKGWGLSYGIFEDNPDKVGAAARALRRRDKIRNTPARDQSSLAVYDVLLQESRQLIKVGKLDEAEAKARKAERMNVVPPVTSDRPEAVLHEIVMARAAKSQPVANTLPADAPRSAVVEGEANALLAKGEPVAAAKKFAEAEELSAAEAGAAPAAAAGAGIELAPAADPAVRQSSVSAVAAEPGPALPRRLTRVRAAGRTNRGGSAGTGGCPCGCR